MRIWRLVVALRCPGVDTGRYRLSGLSIVSKAKGVLIIGGLNRRCELPHSKTVLFKKKGEVRSVAVPRPVGSSENVLKNCYRLECIIPRNSPFLNALQSD